MLRPNRRLMMVAVATCAALALAGCSKPAGPTTGPAEGGMSLGDPNAKVQVDEYASTTCSHCAAFNNDVFPAFKAKYIDTGKVHYTLHPFLTPPEAVSAAGFLLADCAGKDKYFAVIDDLFRSQQEMFETQDAKGTLLKVAERAGMDEARFNACISDPAANKALAERVEKAARDKGIDSTPTFFFNGKKVKSGEMSLEELDAAVAAAGGSK